MSTLNNLEFNFSQQGLGFTLHLAVSSYSTRVSIMYGLWCGVADIRCRAAVHRLLELTHQDEIGALGGRQGLPRPRQDVAQRRGQVQEHEQDRLEEETGQAQRREEHQAAA